ncbi:MAG TPA: LytTR family DNA-binding domain-containing protein [Puia sp.]|jgi:two-component system LytT family response regulator|nr:LytTR family DNA-binding domain-containing protein [Puia sp.]
MIRTILVDDEIDSILVLRRLLKTHCPDVEIVGEADAITKALDIIEHTSPDLLLLDIAIDTGNAFDLLNRLGNFNFQVIFVTAFNDRAIDAFRYSAVDYLLKPVDGSLLQKAVEKAAGRMTEKQMTQNLKVLLDNTVALQVSNQKMAIPTLNGLTFVYFRDILRFEAEGSYTKVVLEDGRQIMATRSIKDYETLLPESIFYRVHHSHIIHLNKIREYRKGRGGYIIMEDGTSIEVAIRRREDFLKRLMK